MENKKLLNYLLKDLSELDELFAENGKNSFDEFEMEFIRNRISESIRLIKLFIERENNSNAEINSQSVTFQKQKQPIAETPDNKLQGRVKEKVVENPAVQTPGVWVEEKSSEVIEQQFNHQNETEEKTFETIIEKEVTIVENGIIAPEIVQEKEIKIEQQVIVETPRQNVQIIQEIIQKELELEDDEPVDIHN